MKRRRVLKQMLLISGGTVLWTSCDEWTYHSYQNLPVLRKHRRAIKDLAQAILPVENTRVDPLESTTDFILTQLNDCYSPEDTDKYLNGLDQYMEILQPIGRLSKATPEKQMNWVKSFEENDNFSEELGFFYRTNKDLALWHFTSSKYVMTQILEFEFVPGYFDGCAAINS